MKLKRSHQASLRLCAITLLLCSAVIVHLTFCQWKITSPDDSLGDKLNLLTESVVMIKGFADEDGNTWNLGIGLKNMPPDEIGHNRGLLGGIVLPLVLGIAAFGVALSGLDFRSSDETEGATETPDDNQESTG
jgi:hypothetical protein